MHWPAKQWTIVLPGITMDRIIYASGPDGRFLYNAASEWAW